MVKCADYLLVWKHECNRPRGVSFVLFWKIWPHEIASGLKRIFYSLWTFADCKMITQFLTFDHVDEGSSNSGHVPYLPCLLFLFGLPAKNGFHIFKSLKKNQKMNSIFWRENYGIHKVLLEHRYPPSFLDCGCLCPTVAEWSCCRTDHVAYKASLALYRKHLLTSVLDHLCINSVLCLAFLMKMHRRYWYIIQLLFYLDLAYCVIFSQIPTDWTISVSFFQFWMSDVVSRKMIVYHVYICMCFSTPLRVWWIAVKKRCVNWRHCFTLWWYLRCRGMSWSQW